jgi:type IV pilus modification protein PilV
MMTICDYAKSRQQGISLIEALIAMVVLSVGLLSVAALQTRALQASHLSYQRSIAVSQANDAVERLWAGICQIFRQTDEQKDNLLFPPIEDIKENLKIIEEDWQSVHKNKMIVDTMAENWDGSINIDENEDKRR